MVAIPDPERRPEHDNIYHALIAPPDLPDVFQTGQIELRPDRHVGFKAVDEQTGRTFEVVGIRRSSDSRDEMEGELTTYGEDGADEPRFVKFRNLVRESRIFTFVEKHPKSSAATTIACGVMVGTLVVARSLHKKSD